MNSLLYFIIDLNYRIKNNKKLDFDYDKVLINERMHKLTLVISPLKGFNFILDPLTTEYNNKIKPINLSFSVEELDTNGEYTYSWVFKTGDLIFRSVVGEDGLILSYKQIDNLVIGFERELEEFLND